MDEKRIIQPQSWTSILIEFPTLPKLQAEGRDESQRVLFVCPPTEKNPTELCLALFGRQIVMQRIQSMEGAAPATRFRFAFLYAPALPEQPGRMLQAWGEIGEAVVLVASKSNVVRSARCVMELLAQPGAGTARGVAESRQAALAPDHVHVDGEEAIWEEALPDIVLVDDEGNLVHATTELGDYRAEYACRYVLAHYHENVNRDKMAEMVHLSPGYFSNLFRSEVGMSFSDYLIMVRIENAKSMLRRFELSVEAISKKCGFNSLAHFSRTFKDRCGLSPLKYRKSPHVAS
ncbi:MAG TPA: AraC family transcriptional regulator [Candidatus Krumholzibacteria bacterium]|nr:AraC family transcriptional regulator [Candidatus Krumholzibacteria bacterium]HPD73004.1 AraC family transcriptional regulator [Candidatus Krumholzibacteria bacterium]HRY41803.1 AraC family transcriptional regulator [Candidatus Krumholzibacteria bacterium]